jgi:phospholipid-binding lipoprotein MlaA
MRGARLILGAIALVAGTAVVPARAQEYDPLERMNRGIFWFNEQTDLWVLEPVGRAWDAVLPDPVQRSVSRFFQNLRFPIHLANNLLQGKVVPAGQTVGRFLVNTTAGVGGLLDPATRIGLPAQPEDFGQTLGVWGVGQGPYLVLPLLGPSTIRDAVGLAVDTAAAVTPWFVDTLYLVAAQTVYVVNERSQYLREVEEAREAAVDYYLFVRNAYLQRRQALVTDGRISDEEAEDLYYFDDGSDGDGEPAAPEPER